MTHPKCAFDGCTKTATCMPKYKAPVIVQDGQPPHDPVGVHVGIAVCAGHFAQIAKDPRFKNNLKMNQALMVAALHHGNYAPDFSKTYLHAVDLNSKEAEEFAALQRKVESTVPPEQIKAQRAAGVVVDGVIVRDQTIEDAQPQASNDQEGPAIVKRDPLTSQPPAV